MDHILFEETEKLFSGTYDMATLSSYLKRSVNKMVTAASIIIFRTENKIECPQKQ